MKKTIFTIVSVVAIAASVNQASAAERHRVRHVAPVAADQFRNANNSISNATWSEYERYREGGAISAPAGR